MCVLQQVGCRFVVHVGTPVVSCSPQSEVRRCKLGSRYERWRNHSLWFFCLDCTVSCLWCLTSLSTSWLLSSHSHYLWQQSLLPLNIQIHAKSIYSEVQFNKLLMVPQPVSLVAANLPVSSKLKPMSEEETVEEELLSQMFSLIRNWFSKSNCYLELEVGGAKWKKDTLHWSTLWKMTKKTH